MSPEQIPFRISAGLKDIIGKELITDDSIAIFELVKNSYDAGAKNVQIIFEDAKSANPEDSKIIIADNGEGMSKYDLYTKWLFVGFSEKKLEKDLKKKPEEKSASYRDKIKRKRIYAGAKGIGRFSSDRLGRHLKLYSKKRNEKEFNTLDVDWKLFEDVQSSEFQTIMTYYNTSSKIPGHVYAEDLAQGTVLEISNLHEKWDRDKLLRLKRYIQRLINPSHDQENLDFEIEIIADEFKERDEGKKDYERVNGTVQNFVFEKLGIKTTHIACEIKDGTITTRILDKGELVVEFEEDNKYGLLQKINANLFYLNPEAKRAFTSLMGVEPVRYGSVFLYRNGFRVYSYGDEGNDWLGLERRKGQGYARFLSTREVMGRIEIAGQQNDFKELSSRSEGLVKSPAYYQLTDFFIGAILRPLERYVVEGLKWDAGRTELKETEKNSADAVLKIIGKKEFRNIHFGKNLLQVLNEKRTRQIPELITNFEYLKKYAKSKEERRYVDEQFKQIRGITKTLAKERNKYKQKYEAKAVESLFLDKALSSDTDKIINLVHSIKISSEAIENQIYEISKAIKIGKKIKDIEKYFDEISIENQKVHMVSKIITSANFGFLSDTIETDLVQYIRQYLEIGFDKESVLLGVQVINGRIEFRTEFNPVDVAVVFDNFMSNSSKAGADMVTILFEKKGEGLRILIGDNGDGVPKDAQELIFGRGFSSRRSGSGLGLHYVKTMLESSGDSVKFLGNDVPNMGKGACFEVLTR